MDNNGRSWSCRYDRIRIGPFGLGAYLQWRYARVSATTQRRRSCIRAKRPAPCYNALQWSDAYLDGYPSKADRIGMERRSYRRDILARWSLSHHFDAGKCASRLAFERHTPHANDGLSGESQRLVLEF